MSKPDYNPNLPDSPRVGGAIRVCGERGLVAFCVECQDWEPINYATGGATCDTCGTRFPPGPRYKKPSPVDPEQQAQYDDEPQTCPVCDGLGCSPELGCMLERNERYRQEVDDDLRRHGEPPL